MCIYLEISCWICFLVHENISKKGESALCPWVYLEKERKNVSEVRERYGKEQSQEYADAATQRPNILAGSDLPICWYVQRYIYLFLGQIFRITMLVSIFRGTILVDNFQDQNFITNFLGTIFWAKKISTNMQRFKNTPLTRTIRKLLAITDGFRDLSSSLNWPTLRHRWLKSNDDIVKQSWGATTCLRRKTTDGLASPLLLLPPKDETTSKIHIIPTYCHIMMIIILWYDMISWYHDISPTYNHFTLLSSQHVSFAHSFVSPCYLPIAFELF